MADARISALLESINAKKTDAVLKLLELELKKQGRKVKLSTLLEVKI